MLYENIPQYTPIYPSVSSFSSRGGTGTLTSSNTFLPRQKPELIAPNGVNTTVNLGGPVFNDGDDYPNFFGTSASAPHAAAAAALLIQAKKKYGLQTSVSPTEIRTGLLSSADVFQVKQQRIPTRQDLALCRPMQPFSKSPMVGPSLIPGSLLCKAQAPDRNLFRFGYVANTLPQVL
jgi:hypothetical protein